MATTSYGVNDTLAVKLWSKKLDGVERHAGFAIRLPAQPTAL